MKPKNLLEKKQLEYFYIEKKLSQEETANALKCNRTDIRNNLKYYSIHTRNPIEAQKLKVPWNKGLTKETNSSLMIASLKISEFTKGRLVWNKGIIQNDKILVKILQEQPSISCEDNLIAFGYSKKTISSNGAIVWVFRKYENARAQKLRKQNPKGIKEYRKRYYQLHKEKLKKKVLDYQKTPRGKLTIFRSTNKHLQKGFIPLTDSLDIEYNWHHIHKKLPFVIAISKRIHRKVGGRKENHCDLANAKSGWNIFIDKNSEVTSFEYVESIVELNYPEQFRQYWFGNY